MKGALSLGNVLFLAAAAVGFCFHCLRVVLLDVIVESPEVDSAIIACYSLVKEIRECSINFAVVATELH